MEVQTDERLTKSGPHVLSDSHVTLRMHIFKHKYKHVCHTCTHIHARLAPTLYHTTHTTQSCPSSHLSLSLQHMALIRREGEGQSARGKESGGQGLEGVKDTNKCMNVQESMDEGERQ